MFTARLIALVTLGFAPAVLLASPKSAKFPGSERPYVSADRRFEVTWQEASGDIPHRLLLRNRVEQTERELLRFDRHVEVFWSPRGAFLVVTNFDASNHANTGFFSMDQKQPIDVESELRRNRVLRKDFFDNHHYFIVSRGWASPNRIRIRFWGYGDVDPRGFELLLEFDPIGEFQIRKGHRGFAKHQPIS